MTKDANVFIQWKGTDVCLDFNCACGASGHFDGDFAYQLRCTRCGTVYEMPDRFTVTPTDRDREGVTQTVTLDEEEE